MTRATNTESLARAHAALEDDLRRLEAAAHPASDEGLDALRECLGVAQAHLADHFRLEEQGGYMRAARERQPRLERAVDGLSHEHRQLADDLRVIAERAWLAERLDGPLREAVRSWVGHVRRHEAREIDLVQDAFNTDITAED